MNLGQTVYFMSLVGGLSGLCCWVLTTLLSDASLGLSAPLETTLNTMLMGGLLSAFTVGFADRWTGDRVVPSWVMIGFFVGSLAGVLTGVAAVPVQALIQVQPGLSGSIAPPLAVWMIAGGLIGLVTGLRWVTVNPYRALHALIGGLIGGSLGGLTYATLAHRDDFFAALAYVMLGTGITLGVTLAPVLLKDGVLRFVSSGDARAQNKYAPSRQEWVVQHGDRFVIGSQRTDSSMSMYSGVQLYIPDASIAPRHAILFEQRKRFFIQQHPENVGAQGQPRFVLQLQGQTVVGTREVRNGDEIVMGQTMLIFSTKKKRGETHADGSGY